MKQRLCVVSDQPSTSIEHVLKVEAIADLSELGAGTHAVPVDDPPAGVRLRDTGWPTTVPVRLEPLAANV